MRGRQSNLEPLSLPLQTLCDSTVLNALPKGHWIFWGLSLLPTLGGALSSLPILFLLFPPKSHLCPLPPLSIPTPHCSLSHPPLSVHLRPALRISGKVNGGQGWHCLAQAQCIIIGAQQVVVIKILIIISVSALPAHLQWVLITFLTLFLTWIISFIPWNHPGRCTRL